MVTDITYPPRTRPVTRPVTWPVTRPTGGSGNSLRRLVLRAARDLESASAADVLRWAADTFDDRFCVVTSMSDGVLAHLAAATIPGVDVLFVDTGYHFVETLGARDAIAATLPVNVVTLTPPASVRDQDLELGPDLWAADPDRCCALRKVRPLRAGLSLYAAWASGVRRDQGAQRAHVPIVGWDEPSGRVTVAPLARWTRADIEDYVSANDVIMNPLRLDGYPSIGCWPCTSRAIPDEGDRSGRWPGLAKTECGIHS